MQATRKRNKITPAEQSARFKETARQLGADERPEAFDNAVKKIAPIGKRKTPKK
jgi:hypothetical protein